MHKEREKLSASAYVVAGLSYIPLIGVVFGIISVIRGLVTKKVGGRKLAFIGAGGIAFTVVLYSGLFYFGFVQRGGVYDGLRVKITESTITSLVQSIEFYRTQNGNYPASLEILRESFPEGTAVFVFDPTEVGGFGHTSRRFYYQLVGDDHYYLLSVGPDGLPFTRDDIHSKVKIGPDSQVGLLIKKQ